VLQSVPSRQTFQLTVISPRETLAIVVPPGRGGGPVCRGPGEVDYLCGECGAVLCDGVSRGMFRVLTFSCHCGALNGVR
jgi:hypothetical protein